MKVDLTVTGGDQLAKAIRDCPTRVNKKVLRQALTEGAEPMRQMMGSLAPRAPGAPDLADNMVISNVTKFDGAKVGDQEAAVAVGPARLLRGAYTVKTRTGGTRTIGASFYALFQEFGTSRHGAQPFARPAFDQGVAGAIAIIRSRLWDALRSAPGGGSSQTGRGL